MEEKEVQGQVEPAIEEVETSETDAVKESVKAEEVSTVEQVEAEKQVEKKKEKVKKVKQEKPQESYEGLSDEEIYTKMQTEQLVERKRKKKIITAVAMGVAFVLAFVIIILATVPISLKPNCIDNSYSEVRLYNGTNIDNAVASFDREDERFGKFKKTLDKSFAQSALSGLFSGAMFAYDIEENHQTFSGAMDELTKNNTYFVRLTYQNERKVTKKSGKVYYSDRYASRNWSFSFTDAYVTVNTDAGFRNTKIYIPVVYPSDEDELYAIVITVKANTNRIREAWSDFVR